MVKLSIVVDDDKHAAFKSRVAVDRLTMAEVVNWAIDDYLSGRWKANARNRGESKPYVAKAKPVKVSA